MVVFCVCFGVVFLTHYQKAFLCCIPRLIFTFAFHFNILEKLGCNWDTINKMSRIPLALRMYSFLHVISRKEDILYPILMPSNSLYLHIFFFLEWKTPILLFLRHLCSCPPQNLFLLFILRVLPSGQRHGFLFGNTGVIGGISPFNTLHKDK